MGTREEGITLDAVRRVFDEVERPGTPLTASEVAEEVGCVRRTAHSKLQALVEAGDLRTKKVGARGRVWWRPVETSTGEDGAVDTAGEGGTDAVPEEDGDAASADSPQFRSLVDAVEEYAIFILDPDGNVRSWNAGAERIKGYEREEILGEHFSTFYTEGDREAGVPERNLAAAARDGTAEDEGWRVRADGTRFWATVTITAIRGEDGDLQGLAKVTRDMTDRREREQAVLAERNLFDRVLEASPVGIGVFDPDGEAECINRQFAELLGLPGEAAETYELGDRSILDADGDPIPFDELPAQRTIATGESVTDMRVRIDDDGRSRWLSVDAEPVERETGMGVVVTMTDVTRLEQQARRLERQRDDLESELSEVFERVDDGFYGLDEEFRFTYVNGRAEELLRTPEAELIGENIWKRFPEAVETPTLEAFETAMETQEPTRFETYFEPLEFWVEATVYPSETGLSVYFQDSTERKERERELELYETIVETVEDGVYVLDEEFHFTMVNEAYAEMTGYDRDELVGTHCSLVVSDEVSEESARLIEEIAAGDGDNAALEADILRADGSRLRAESNFSAFRPKAGERPWKVGVVRDVSERVERERALEESERRYRALAENFPNGVVALFDRDLQYELAGGSNYEDLGIDYDGFVGTRVGEHHPSPDLANSLREKCHEALAGESSGIEFEWGDRTFQARIVPVADDDGEVFAGMIMTQDVTEQREHERELEESRRLYQTLVENFPNGIVTLFDDELRHLIAGGELYDRFEMSPEEVVGTSPVDGDGTEHGRLLEEHYRAALDGETRTFETEYLDRTVQLWTTPVTDDDGEVFAGMAMSQDITERVERERRLEQQREHLAALDDLNGVVRDITDAVIDQSTHEEIERVVCEGLATSDSYEFAWMGEVDEQSQTVALREEAGVEGYLDGVTISVDPNDERSSGPTGRAILDGETVISRDVRADSNLDPWRDHVETYEFRSSAAIPIGHEGTLYGVLNVYADRPRAFDEAEREVVSQLGEVVGHAIAAIDRKRALMSDEVTELRFRIRNVFDALDLPASTDGRITFDEAVPIGDGVFLEYGTVTEDAIDAMEAVVDQVPHWEEVTVRPPEDGVAKFELRLDQPPVVSALAANGGYVEETVVEDGDIRMTVHLSPTVEARRIIDVVEEAYPAAEMVARRQTTRPGDAPDRMSLAMTEELTDRQRAALDAAYHSGFFEWPRETSGEDVAESLGVSSPTFYQHLRKAENKLLSALYSAPAPATT